MKVDTVRLFDKDVSSLIDVFVLTRSGVERAPSLLGDQGRYSPTSRSSSRPTSTRSSASSCTSPSWRRA
ncbi:MAG TPA: hypothetical protein VKD28_15435, partial [Gemmatimonadales bacterium]|nr:hypothetical protein [Gemmatimonadales bacterium]